MLNKIFGTTKTEGQNKSQRSTKSLLWVASCLCALMVQALSACSQPGTASKTVILDSIIRQFDAENNFHGSVLVVQDGKVILDKGYGFSNKASGTVNDPSTIYQVGSITKQFTAAIMMMLQQQGKLNPGDTISKFFPELRNGEKITIHHLLSHRSGLYNYTRDPLLWNSTLSEKKLVDYLNEKPLDFEPGSRFEYCNSGYWLAGRIIEKVTGKKYEQVVRDWIFTPLKMYHSGFDYASLNSDRKSRGYYDGMGFRPAKILDSTMAFSAGAIYSTTGDMYKWAEAMSKRTLLWPTSWKLMMTDNGSKYGYGLVVDSVHGEKNIWHNGSIDGFMSNYYNLPDRKIIIITFSNYMQSRLTQLCNILVAALIDKPYKLPEARKEMKIAADSLGQFVGNYELVPGFSIKVTVDGDKLMAQATGQDSFQLFPERKDFFFLKVVDAQIEFTRDSTGNVDALILHQNGQKQKGKKQ